MAEATNTTNPSHDWTPETIRAATPFPKPEGAIDKALDSIRRELDPLERRMLLYIAENADLVDAGMSSGGSSWNLPRFWLLVPAPSDLIDFLATFEVERGEDMGVDADSEPAVDDEPSIGATTAIDHRHAWRAGPQRWLGSDREADDEENEDDGTLEPNDQRPVTALPPDVIAPDAAFRPLKVHRAQDRPRQVVRMIALRETAK